MSIGGALQPALWIDDGRPVHVGGQLPGLGKSVWERRNDVQPAPEIIGDTADSAIEVVGALTIDAAADVGERNLDPAIGIGSNDQSSVVVTTPVPVDLTSQIADVSAHRQIDLGPMAHEMPRPGGLLHDHVIRRRQDRRDSDARAGSTHKHTLRGRETDLDPRGAGR